MSDDDLTIHQQLAAKELRDEHGHFAHIDEKTGQIVTHEQAPRDENGEFVSTKLPLESSAPQSPQVDTSGSTVPIPEFRSPEVSPRTEVGGETSIPVTPALEPKNTKKPNPLTRLFSKTTSIEKTDDDDLVDIRVGNPLRKITELLQEIKRQKAFSFTLKGSLGIMGVVMVAGTFGIMGGTRALCDKGIQTKVGTVKILRYQDPMDETWLDYVPILSSILPKHTSSRTVMLTPDNKILKIKLPNNSLISTNYQLQTTDYFATGSYDTCSETLSLDDQSSLEIIQ